MSYILFTITWNITIRMSDMSGEIDQNLHEINYLTQILFLPVLIAVKQLILKPNPFKILTKRILHANH